MPKLGLTAAIKTKELKCQISTIVIEQFGNKTSSEINFLTEND